MINSNFHEKIVLALSFLILNNYLLLSLSFPSLIIKINFIIFLITILTFYLKNFLDNQILKIFFLIVILISLGTPLYEWDPRSIWLFHAKRIFYDNSIFSIIDNYAEFSHNDYPTLVPALSASLASLIGHWNEVFPKLSFSFMYLPALILTLTLFKKTHYLIFLSIVLFIIGKYLFNGWADGLLAIYFGLSSFLMYVIFLDEKNIYKNKLLYLFITFSFFVSLTLIKNEGIALLVILFISTLLIKTFRKELKKDFLKILLLSFAFLPIIFWKYFCYSNGIGYNDYINVDILSNLLPRLYNIDNYLLISYFLFLNEKFLICLIFFLISFWAKWDVKMFSFVSITLLIYISILFFIFLSTPYDFYWQLNSTATRVIKSLSFLLAFFGLYNLKNLKW